jgi:hypothetical protein
LTRDYGANYEKYRNTSAADSTVFDARQARWKFSNYPKLQDYPVDIRNVGNAAWCGGTVLGTMDSLAEWPTMYDSDSGGGNGAAFIFGDGGAPDFTVDGVRFHNVWDGVRPRAGSDNFTVRNCWFSYVRDDAIENDHLYNGTIDDCLFDGVFVGFSCRGGSGSTTDGTGNTVTVQNCLVRLQPFPGKPKDHYTPETGHMGFFKWSSLSPKVVLKNNVFMAEQLPWNGTAGLEFPQGNTGMLIESENNTIVWLGSGDYPGTVQPGFTVTTDRSVWDDARTAWINAHPRVSRFAWDPVSDVSVRDHKPLLEKAVPRHYPGVLFDLRGREVPEGMDLPAGIYINSAGGKILKR